MPVLALDSVTKTYAGSPPIEALRGIDLAVDDGGLLAVAGPSGSGKSTLLHVMGTLDRPSAGTVQVAGFDTSRYAVIDVGTNSVKFHVGERHADGSTHTVVDRAEITRLGEGQGDTGRLSEEAIERFGLWAGGWMTLARLLRCQPFGTSGIDLVPETAPPGARCYRCVRRGAGAHHLGGLDDRHRQHAQPADRLVRPVANGAGARLTNATTGATEVAGGPIVRG